jgi:hypothetical protein
VYNKHETFVTSITSVDWSSLRPWWMFMYPLIPAEVSPPTGGYVVVPVVQDFTVIA